MKRCLVLLVLGSLFLCGCNSGKPPAPASTGSNQVQNTSSNVGQASEATTPNNLTSGVFDLAVTSKPLSSEEKHDAALVDAVKLISEKRYTEAQSTLEQAQSSVNSEVVAEQLTRVQALKARQSAFEQTTQDIQAILDNGQPQKAGELISAAMGQYSDADETSKLIALRRQADVLYASQVPAPATLVSHYKSAAETALKDNNLRAAALAYEQALTQEPTADFAPVAKQTIDKLNRFDNLRQQGYAYRSDSGKMDESLAAYQQALQLWDTPDVRQEMNDLQLAIQKHRPRLAVADFEVRGSLGIAEAGKLVAEELLGGFKTRFELLEHAQVKQVTEQLALQGNDLFATETGRMEFAKLAKAQFLVVGSVSEIGGTVIHARLIDLKTGLIMQTGKVVGSTFQEATAKLPSLANMLQMNDKEKLAYEKRLAADAAAPQVVQSSRNLPAVPVARQSSQPMPPAVVAWSNRPPSLGELRVDDFQRLPPMPQMVPNSPVAPPVIFIEQERPVRAKMLRIQLELGDNFFARGKYREAHAKYLIALDLDPLQSDVRARIDLCQPYLPPPVVVATPVLVPVVRERIAFLNFLVMTSDPVLVPAELSTWLPDQMAAYFSPPFDVVERGELNYYMGRMGMTVADVLRDPAARKWLGRALGVRYFVLGQVESTAGVMVTSRMIDAEFGWEVGKAQAMARDAYELKFMLGELARNTYRSSLPMPNQPSVPVFVLEQEVEYLQACEFARQSKFQLALDLGLRLKKRYPGHIRLSVDLGRWEDAQRRFAWEENRRMELLRQRDMAAAAARRQNELAMAAEAARQDALRRQSAMAESERIRQRELAHQQMLSQARIAIQGKKFSFGIQLFEGALRMRPDDQPTLRELALARAKSEEEQRRIFAEEKARVEEARRRQLQAELVRTKQELATERARNEAEFKNSPIFLVGQRQDDTEYNRLLDQAQKMKAAGKFDSAVDMLQSAKRIRPGSEVERLLADALMEQARSQAKSEDAAKRTELERKLAQEETRRKKAEEQGRQNQQLYIAALKAAREAQQKKDYVVATAKYQQAQQLFQTDEVLTGLQSIKDVQEQQQREAKLAEEKRQRTVQEAGRLMQAGKTAQQQGNFDLAIQNFTAASKLQPEQAELSTLLTQAQLAKDQALAKQRQAELANQQSQVKAIIGRAQLLAKGQQYDAAIALLDKAPSSDAAMKAQLDEARNSIKKAQTEKAAAEFAIAKKKEEDRKLADTKMKEAEQKKQQATSAIRDAQTAILAGDADKAITMIKQVQQLSPEEPALRKLQQDLANLQAQVRGKAEAKAQLEARERAKALAKQKQNEGEVTKLLDQARTALQAKDFDKVEKLISQASNLDPSNTGVGKLQRELLAAKTDAAQKKAVMNAEEKKKKDAEAAKIKVEFDEYIKKGKTALNDKDFDAAVKNLEAAARLMPEDPNVAFYLGMAKSGADAGKREMEMARKKAAEEEAARKKAEDEAKAMAKKEAEANAKADEELKKRLAMDRDAKLKAEKEAETNRNKFQSAMISGNLALASKKFDDAITAYQTALKLFPDNAEAKKQMEAAISQKNAANQKKDPPKKEDPAKGKSNFKMEENKKEESKTAATNDLYNQAMVKANQSRQKGDWQKALDYYNEALKLKPEDKAAKDLANQSSFQLKLATAKSLLSAKKNPEAVKELEEALKLIPNHPEATKLLKQAKEAK